MMRRYLPLLATTLVLFAACYFVLARRTHQRVALQFEKETATVFSDQYRLVLSAQMQALAASYIYRLELTPEEKAIQRVMRKISTASASDIEDLIRAEDSSVRYIDDFDKDNESFRASIGELSSRANAIGDEEIRDAALNVCKQFTATLDLTDQLATTQRESSHENTIFFNYLQTKQFPPDQREMDATNSKLKLLRENSYTASIQHELAFGSFRGIVERKLGLKLPPIESASQ